MLPLDTVFTSLKYITLALAILVTIGALAFPTAQSQASALGYIGLNVQTPEIDTPAIFTLIGIIWFLFILSQTSWKMLKVASDRIIIEGVDKPDSCVSSQLHIKGDFGFIRMGSIKLLPDVGGKTVGINPLTHIRKAGTTIFMEAHASPDTGLEDVPPDLKTDIYQRREGIFGIDKCSVGYLSSKELQENPNFKGEDYGEDKGAWTTSTFITAIQAQVKAISVMFDYFGNDTTPIEKKLASIKRIGAAANRSEKKGLMGYIMVNE